MKDDRSYIQQLRHLAAEGDTLADERLLDLFLAFNSDLPTSAGRSGLEFRTRDGRIELLLRLDQNAAINEMKAHWHIVKEALRRLSAWQGTPREDPAHPDVELLVSLRRKGYSYRTIAEVANGAIAYLLTKALDEQQQATSWIWEVWARQFLHRLGLKEDDVEVWCDAIIEELREGRPPFPPEGGPVDGERIRYFFRYWAATHRRSTSGKNRHGFSVPDQ